MLEVKSVSSVLQNLKKLYFYKKPHKKVFTENFHKDKDFKIS